MKYLLSIAALALSLSAHAETPKAFSGCDFMPCGTYEGHGQNYDEHNNPIEGTYFERIVIEQGAKPSDISLKVDLYENENSKEAGYTLHGVATFAANGTYTIKGNRDDGKAVIEFAAGVCKFGVCLFNFVPFKHSEGITGNTEILRFEDGKLTRTMMASIKAGDIDFQKTELVLVKK